MLGRNSVPVVKIICFSLFTPVTYMKAITVNQLSADSKRLHSKNKRNCKLGSTGFTPGS